MMKRFLFALGCVLASHLSFAGEELLEKYNIDPDILHSGFSSMFLKQRYSYKLDITVIDDKGVHEDHLYGFFEPETEFGIDHYFMFRPDQLEVGNKGEYKDLLNNIMKTQNRLTQMGNSFDPKSLKVIYENEQDTVLAFKFIDYGIPQDIAYLRLLTGHIMIRDGELKSIVLTNDRDFRKSFATISNYRQESTFIRNSQGELIKDSASLSFEGKRWGKTRKVEMRSNFIEFENKGGVKHTVRPDEKTKVARLTEAGELETVRVNLDRMFPIWGAEVRKRGFDLPLPYGISLSYRDQINELNFTSFEINGSKGFEAIFDPNASNGDIHSKTPVIRADVFVLPFMNVFAVLGKAEASAQLRIAPSELVNDVNDIVNTIKDNYCSGLGGYFSAEECANFSPSQLPDYIPLPLELEVTTAGLGTTLAAGYKNFFGTVTATYTQSVSEVAGTATDALVISPMVGYQYPQYRARLLLGAEYQDLAASMEGSLSPDFNYNIGITTEKWAWVIGAHKELSDHFDAAIMYSEGDQREAWTLNLGYRF